MQDYQPITAWEGCPKCGSVRTPEVVYTTCPFDLSGWIEPHAWDKWTAQYAAAHHGRVPGRSWGQEWLACACARCGYSWEMQCRPGPEGER